MWTVKASDVIIAAEILASIPMRNTLLSSSLIQISKADSGIEVSLRAEAAANITLTGKGHTGLKKPVYISRGAFLPFMATGIKYRKSDTFTFAFEDDKLIVTQGRRKASFQYAEAASGYLDEKDSKGGTELKLGDTLKAALIMAASYTATDRPELDSVLLEGRHDRFDLLSSNQIVAFFSWGKMRKQKVSIYLPVGLLPFLKLNDIQVMRIREDGVVLDFANGYVWHPLSKKATESFPKKALQQLLAEGEKWPQLCQLDVKCLSVVLACFSEYLSSIKKEDWTIELSGRAKEKTVTIESKVAQAKFKEKLPINSRLDSDFSLIWPLDILLPFVSSLEDEGLLAVLSDKGRPSLLKGKRAAMIISRISK